jgi:hypothetical protein
MLNFFIGFSWIGGFFEGCGLLVGFQGPWISFVADVKLQKRMAMVKLIRPATAFARRTKVLPDEGWLWAD